MIRILQQDNRIVKAAFAIIIGAAIITMVIALVPGIFDNGASADTTVYAVVHGPGYFGKISGDTKTVKTDAVARAAQQQMEQQRLPSSPFIMQYMMQRAGQQAVGRAVLEREADKLGLSVSDADLQRELMTGALSTYLFPDGHYIGKDGFINFVESNFRMSTDDFEDAVRSDLELQRLQALVTSGLTVSDAAVREQFMKDGTKLKFDYAVIASADVKKTINPSDAELQAFFKQNAPKYATAAPETRKIEFFSLDASNLPGGKPAILQADIQAYYTSHQAQYKTDEEVQTRHILIPVANGADAATDAAAKAKAADVLKQLKAGGNFAELAKKYSSDPGSKDKGGELPMIATAGLDPAYAKAAMALNPGQTSDLVRSQLGWHIIQTIKKQPAGMKSLDEVKDTIVPILAQQKSGAEEQAFAQKLADEAKKNGMQKTADAHGMHVTTTDYIAKDGVIGNLAESSSLLTQAFSTAKGAPPAFAATGEGFAVFQVDDVKPAHAPAFADAKAQILNDYRDQKAPDLLNAQLNKLAARAKVLNDLKKAAAEMNVPVKSSDLVTKDSQVPDLGSMAGPGAVAFTLAKGQISGPINTGPNGVVLQVTDKEEPTADEIAKGFGPARDKLLETRRNELFNTYAEQLLATYTKAGAIVQSQKKAPASPLGN
ncbi:MAG TPA: peptidyl-prolyl cis-trans isomerase [Acidobacteriaceae bacterium]|nr:peptidyl-prolyl cis-trans isomerase [Acidobacteriaceae bacterium]